MPSRRMSIMIAFLGVLALVGSACGKQAPKSTSSGNADQKAVESVIRASIKAENAKNADAFLALWTDKGLEAYDSGTREEIKAGKEGFGEDKIKILGFVKTDVAAATATSTVDGGPVEYKVAQVAYRVKFSLIKQGDAWLLDGFEFIGSPPAKAGTPVLDIKAQEYAFILDKQTIGGNIALKFTNTGKEQHELTLYKGPDGVDVTTARKALENVDGSELKDIPTGYAVDHVTFAEPGQTMDVTFSSSLKKGTYVFACYIPQGGFGEQGPVNPDGKPHIKLGMAAILTVE